MNPNQPNSLPPSYFDNLYSENIDPWNFETSEYEASKYAATIAALPKARYRKAFEVGCSIGVLTQLLAEYCESLLSIDVSELALAKAQERCADLPQVRFKLMGIPQEFPDDIFDLVLLSEVGYYLSQADLLVAQQKIIEHLEPGGNLLLVHWTLYAKDYPLSGDEVHEAFIKRTEADLRHLSSRREAEYRLDLFEKM